MCFAYSVELEDIRASAQDQTGTRKGSNERGRITTMDDCCTKSRV